MTGAAVRMLPDGRRLHLQHGPIDLIAEAWGEPGEVGAAYAQAAARFETILDELVAELALLRRPAGARPRRFASPVARRMERAAAPLTEQGKVFLTPMAAVAGAVADEVLAALSRGRRLEKAYVNNGGDAALLLGPGAALRLAVAGTGNGLADRLAVREADAARGVATSGWRGRSFSLGIADAVTVLARNGAAADAAATVIANAVDLPGHPAIAREPAQELSPDSDLGSRLVTVGVGALAAPETARALDAGRLVAERLLRQGRIAGAALFLGGAWRITGSLRPAPPAEKAPRGPIEALAGQNREAAHA